MGYSEDEFYGEYTRGTGSRSRRRRHTRRKQRVHRSASRTNNNTYGNNYNNINNNDNNNNNNYGSGRSVTFADPGERPSESDSYDYYFEPKPGFVASHRSSTSKQLAALQGGGDLESHNQDGGGAGSTREEALAGAEKEAEDEGRRIQPNDAVHDEKARKKLFVSNYVTTAKYTLITFLPKNLYEQFGRLANLYFLMISCLQVFTDLSPTGRFTTLGPLVVVLTITALKEAFEDWNRHKQDAEVNGRGSEVIERGSVRKVRWEDILVGDIVRVRREEFIPCDLVLLSSSEDQAACYIETASLDGETNLKNRQALPETAELTDEAALARFDATLVAEKPNNRLYKFDGFFQTKSGEKWPLTPQQILLRGAQLRNTDWVFGVAVFTGHDTKLMMNSRDAPSKRSRVEKKTNIQIAWIFALQISLCILCAIGRYLFARSNERESWYLGTDADFNLAANAATSFFTFLILLNNFIPISLYVSMEMVKFVQAFQINNDMDMYHAANDTPALARTSNLNEELGQVEYIFSDKTGTLTRNMMQFKKCCVGGVAYGRDEDLKDSPDINYNFNDPRLLEDMSRGGEQAERLELFATVLSVCHTVIPEWSEKLKRTTFQASSPDEAALVSAAQLWGFAFVGRTPKTVTIAIGGREVVYEVLSVLEFNSDRKRQSVVVRDPRGRLRLWTKGADSVMFERLRGGPFNERTKVYLDEFAEVGLRTLVVAESDLEPSQYEAWARKFNAAQAELVDREAKVDAVCELLEVDMRLVGMTAIEDKLQDGVPRTIATLALAGLKIWMLTGDKQGTAINIGFSCRLLTPRMHQMIINEDTLPATQKVIQEHLWDQKNNTDPDSLALIIDGKTLHFALDPTLRLELLELARKCTAVICCRVTPKQKADVVSLVSDNVGAVTLAIGDGANDVSMIQAAHVGIGISGEEGLQAARAADYAIAQFKFLQKLLLVHGRWSYRRISKLITYSFYKNIALYSTQFWFVFFNGFSGQSLYEGWTIAMFNLVFASFPILALATLDQDVSKAHSVVYPALYVLGQRSHYFNGRVFWAYILNALWHSLVLFFVVQGIFAHDVVGSDGRGTGLYAVGVVLYAVVVMVVNLKVGLETAAWTWINHVTTWGSMAALFLFYLVYHLMWDSPFPLASIVYMVIYRLMPNPAFWFSLFVAPAAALLRDWTWKYYKRTYTPELYHIVQEIAKQEKALGKPETEFWDARPDDLPDAAPENPELVAKKRDLDRGDRDRAPSDREWYEEEYRRRPSRHGVPSDSDSSSYEYAYEYA